MWKGRSRKFKGHRADPAVELEDVPPGYDIFRIGGTKNIAQGQGPHPRKEV
jgi:hypothetical protein